MIFTLVRVTVTVEVTTPDDTRVAALVVALRAELDELYPEPFPYAHPTVRSAAEFLVALVDGEVAGCCALQPLDDGWSELKRMYVVPSFRGRGIAQTLMVEVEVLARVRGYTAIKLETGVRQPEAIAVYERAGFTPIEAYPPYDKSTISICMAKHVERTPD